MSHRSPGITIELTPARWVVAIILAVVLLWLAIAMVSKGIPPRLDTHWSPPLKLSHSETSWASGFSACIWNGISVGLGGGGSFYLLDTNGAWVERSVPDLENYSLLAVDAQGATAIFFDVTYSANKVATAGTLVRAELTPGGNPRVTGKVRMQPYHERLFQGLGGETAARRETSLLFGGGTVEATNVYLPYFARDMRVTTINRPKGPITSVDWSAPTDCGLFFSPDLGSAWQPTSLVTSAIPGQATFRVTRSQLYFLRTEHPSTLYCSVQLSGGSGWSKPDPVLDTLQAGRGFAAETGSDTLHLCWMDMRLKKGLGFFIYGDWDVGRRNNLVFYSHRKDTDPTWSKGRRLSGGLSYCESPSMSVEGKNIVVAWHHYERPYTRAGVYYTVSKNGGRTWARPKRVNSPRDSTAEDPKVLLHEGTIHLFYDRSEFPSKRCDLMYQRRPFPD